MSRRRRQEPLLEELAAPFAHLPLKAGVLTGGFLAIVGWALPLLVPLHGLDLSGYLAIAGRWIVWALAALILVAAASGAARRSGERARFDSTLRVEDLTWSEFEGYLAEYFRRRGNLVTPRGGASADGGVDLVLEGPKGRWIVQAKHWKSHQVGVTSLRQLWGVLGDERADGAIFVTSGGFTAEARAFAHGKQLELIDGPALRLLVAGVRPGPTVLPSVACPSCGKGSLEKRLARRGKNAGSYFLGCSRYPDCRYTRNL